MHADPSPSAWRPLAGPLAARAKGRGERLIFVHGFTQTSRSWETIADHLEVHLNARFAERLSNRRFEVVVVDLPGHGDSANVRADLRRTADLLAATAGAGTYVGYSLGARVCLHLALMYPHVVDRLALLGASPGIVDDDERAARRTSDEHLAQHIVDVGVEAFIDEWVAQPLFDGLVLDEAERAERLRNTANGLASSLRLSGTGTQMPLWERLIELSMPVLALAGDRDAKFVSIAERIAASVQDGSFSIIQGAGHAAHLQQPMQVITLLEALLKR